MAIDQTTETTPTTPDGGDRGFERKRRSALPWWIGGGAAVAIAAVVAVIAVQGAQPSAADGAHFGTDLKVAYLSTDAAQEALLEFVADEIAPDYGITVEASGIGDPNQLHRAVSEGEIAATIYAHAPWLAQSNAANGWTLEPTVPVFQWAYSIWSSQHTSFDSIPDGATIGILDDPANTAQALLLLANDGVIGLDKKVDPATATLGDIVENPRDLQFKQIAFGSAARSLDDFDAIISYNFEFVAAGLPSGYKIHAPEAPLVFAAQLAVSKPYLGEENITKLVEAFSDPRIAEFLTTTDDRAVQGQLTPVSSR